MAKTPRRAKAAAVDKKRSNKESRKPSKKAATVKERRVAKRSKPRSTKMPPGVKLLKKSADVDWTFAFPAIWQGKVEKFIEGAPAGPLFDLIVTSPPYNIGKAYEKREPLLRYLSKQRKIIQELVARLKDGGSLCWQVGNHIHKGEIYPLDLEFHKIIRKLGLKLRNRIVWRFGHGLHSKQRFSGRYEVVLWYTKGDKYTFNLDAVRIASKYPGKKHYKGKNKGKYSSNPLGKNPEDVWEIPNVKGNHVEKTTHPCQFPVGLIERLVLALTNEGDVVFDPFAGVSSAGVAAVVHNRRYAGCEPNSEYVRIGRARVARALKGAEKYRSHSLPIYDHTQSPLSIKPVQQKTSKKGTTKHSAAKAKAQMKVPIRKRTKKR